MPNPYKPRVDVRRYLNVPGFHGGAYVVAYVEDTSGREITKRDPFGYEAGRYVNPQPRIILEIADCSNRINLEFELHSELDVENSLHKVDVLAAVVAEFRAGLVEEARLFREREPEVERLNRSERQPHRPRPRHSAGRYLLPVAVTRAVVIAVILATDQGLARVGSGALITAYGAYTDRVRLAQAGETSRCASSPRLLRAPLRRTSANRRSPVCLVR